MKFGGTFSTAAAAASGEESQDSHRVIIALHYCMLFVLTYLSVCVEWTLGYSEREIQSYVSACQFFVIISSPDIPNPNPNSGGSKKWLGNESASPVHWSAQCALTSLGIVTSTSVPQAMSSVPPVSRPIQNSAQLAEPPCQGTKSGTVPSNTSLLTAT